jgi:hypothetical protein
MTRPSLITPGCVGDGMATVAPGCVGDGMATVAPGCVGDGMATAAPGCVGDGMEPRKPSDLTPDRLPQPPLMASAASPGMVLSAIAKNRIEPASNGRAAPELGVRRRITYSCKANPQIGSSWPAPKRLYALIGVVRKRSAILQVPSHGKNVRKNAEWFRFEGTSEESWPRLFGQLPANFKWISAGVC